jgi:hypothetical protein
MSLVHNEQTKLAANAIDRASTACLAVGVFGPLAATLYDFGGTAGHGTILAVGSLFWLAAAGLLHIMAHRVLRRLR